MKTKTNKKTFGFIIKDGKINPVISTGCVFKDVIRLSEKNFKIAKAQLQANSIESASCTDKSISLKDFFEISKFIHKKRLK